MILLVNSLFSSFCIRRLRISTAPTPITASITNTPITIPAIVPAFDLLFETTPDPESAAFTNGEFSTAVGTVVEDTTEVPSVVLVPETDVEVAIPTVIDDPTDVSPTVVVVVPKDVAYTDDDVVHTVDVIVVVLVVVLSSVLVPSTPAGSLRLQIHLKLSLSPLAGARSIENRVCIASQSSLPVDLQRLVKSVELGSGLGAIFDSMSLQMELQSDRRAVVLTGTVVDMVTADAALVVVAHMARMARVCTLISMIVFVVFFFLFWIMGVVIKA